MIENVAGSAVRGERGLFVTFEGADGAGKTTQITLLEANLRAQGYAVTRTREPGGDPVGERVRDMLLHGAVGAEAELFLFAAARAQNVQVVVRPALEAGHIVLCDRYTDSTLAYQGHGRGLPLELLTQVNFFATGGLTPDLTLLLDLPPSEGLARQVAEEQNRLDLEAIDFHERVRLGFREIAQREPGRMILVDAARSIEAVGHDIQAAVASALASRAITAA